MDANNMSIRQERIERLLKELEYEVTRGMIDSEIDETLLFRFYVPLSNRIKDGVVLCEFRTRPIQRIMMDPRDMEPRLKLVK